MVYRDVIHELPLMGHSVFVNGDKVLTCMESLLRPGPTLKTRSVSGLVYVPSNGNVTIGLLYDQATIRLNAASTYFGLIKFS